jgi:cytochrome P450
VTRGSWPIPLAVTVSHAACPAALRHRGLGRIWSDATPLERFTSFNLLHRNSLLENEPPAHTRLRRLISWAFGRGQVQRLAPMVAELATGMVEQLAEKIAADGEADLLVHLTQPLPVQVIAELLSVPGSTTGAVVESHRETDAAAADLFGSLTPTETKVRESSPISRPRPLAVGTTTE